MVSSKITTIFVGNRLFNKRAILVIKAIIVEQTSNNQSKINLPVLLNKNPSNPCLIRKIRVLNNAKIA
jgi:hypothetical protein